MLDLIIKSRFGYSTLQDNTDNSVCLVLKGSPIFQERISSLQLENTFILYAGELALVLYPSACCQGETLGLPYLPRNKYHG